jgi:CRP/FNR family transcriptional regulator
MDYSCCADAVRMHDEADNPHDPCGAPWASPPERTWVGALACREAAAHGLLPPRLQRIAAGVTLIHENAPTRCFHMVLAGDFKLLKTAADGYEQVLDFAGSFDVLGFDGLASGHYGASAVALQDASVYTMAAADVEQLRHASLSFDRQWQATLSRQLARLGELALLMAAVSAERRVARFLLQLSRRMEARGQSPRRLRLRMSRREIASHLGLAHESISRSLTALDGAGFVRVCQRDLEIVDDAGLEAFAQCTRGASVSHRPAAAPALHAARPRAMPGLLPGNGFVFAEAMRGHL